MCSASSLIAASTVLLVVIMALVVVIVIQCVVLFKMKRSSKEDVTNDAPTETTDAQIYEEVCAVIHQDEYAHVSPNEAYEETEN